MRMTTRLAGLILAAASLDVQALDIEHLASFGPGIEGGAEIAAYDAQTARLFVTNAEDNTLDRYGLSDSANPVTLSPVDLSGFGDGPNSVAVANGVVAVAVQADPAQDPGVVVFFDADGNNTGQVTVGALPDMLTFTPDGQTLLVANEGEPSDDYTVDPEGSVSIVDLSAGPGAATVQTAEFSDFNRDGLRGADVPADLRIFGPGATVAQDLEPEYITVEETGITAWVSLQENNGLAVIDIPSATVTDLIALGFKDHSLPGNGFDASDEDGPGGGPAINIADWPVFGMYQPDAVSSFTVGGVPYILTANEGDARDYDAFSEEERVEDITLDAAAFPDAATLQLPENLGRLNITLADGDPDADDEYESLFAYGGRSFSVWNGQTGERVWDSGSEFETLTAGFGLPLFNDDDGRSDNKGPEPEGIDVGTVGAGRYAFIGLERIDGFFVYDVSQPQAPAFEAYVPSESGDEAPEGVLFVPESDTPDGTPWLLLTHEDSGTVALYGLAGEGPNGGGAAPIPALGRVERVVLAALLGILGLIAVRRFT